MALTGKTLIQLAEHLQQLLKAWKLWKLQGPDYSFYFKLYILVFFFHNSYGTMEFPDCENLVGADCVGNLRWANTDPSMRFSKLQ